MSSIDRRRKTVAKRGSHGQFPAWVLSVYIVGPTRAFGGVALGDAFGAEVDWQSYICLTSLCSSTLAAVLKYLDRTK